MRIGDANSVGLERLERSERAERAERTELVSRTERVEVVKRRESPAGSRGKDQPGQASDDARISDRAALLRDLKSLRDTNPGSFRATLASAAKQLREVAEKTSSPEARSIEELANKMTEAEQTGDLSKLARSSDAASGYGSPRIRAMGRPLALARLPTPEVEAARTEARADGRNRQIGAPERPGSQGAEAADANRDGVISRKEERSFTELRPRLPTQLV